MISPEGEFFLEVSPAAHEEGRKRNKHHPHEMFEPIQKKKEGKHFPMIIKKNRASISINREKRRG